MLTSIELCAGGGGQALGLEQAGFEHLLLIENDKHACLTLKKNRPQWNVVNINIENFVAKDCKGIDLVAGGVPCQPFSIGGKQLGAKDERDLFPEAIRIVKECQPKAVMLENVRGLLDPIFESYREQISRKLESMGYQSEWRLFNASNYGVPQLRPRVVLIAIKENLSHNFIWPKIINKQPQTVGETLYDLMASNGWQKAGEWRKRANKIAPTIVGGSKKHGGPDLGPTRARRAWAELGVNGRLIADEPPSPTFQGSPGFEDMPYLTIKMVARLQGFPDDWVFEGKKTAAYRQVGNAFPPPVAKAIGLSIVKCLTTRQIEKLQLMEHNDLNVFGKRYKQANLL